MKLQNYIFSNKKSPQHTKIMQYCTHFVRFLSEKNVAPPHNAMNTPELIVMLTHNDYTVADAEEIFDRCQQSKAQYWGIKETPLPLSTLRRLFAHMRQCGKTTVLEVVEYTPAAGLEGALMAAECGCDILMGTCFTDEINRFCLDHNLRYMPFVGTISGRPSVLQGTAEEMIAEANRYLQQGAYGIDLLGYRHTGDASSLIAQFVTSINAPVCVAGSINSLQRLSEIKAIAPWAFTIGSAFFDHQFGNTFQEQIDTVCHFMAE